MGRLDKDLRATSIEPEALSVVTPEAVKARINEFFEDADLEKTGVSSLGIRTITITAEASPFPSPDNDPRFPELHDHSTVDLHLASDVMVKEAAITVNGVEFARRIIPAEPILFLERINRTAILTSKHVTAIHELYGVYEIPDEWHASSDHESVAINVLDFDDGSSRVFFPDVVANFILPDSEKVNMIRQLGVKA
jgi:hypothetical protein